MTIRIGDTAPDFYGQTQLGRLDFHTWARGHWTFFFSHPADYTPVCTTEMARTATLAREFAARGVEPLGLSTDGVSDHRSWIDDVNAVGGVDLRFPIVADTDLAVARLYGMIHPNESGTAAVRSVFIIDPALTMRLTMTYPMSVGRDFTEILRVIDALQLGDARRVATPADWRPGGDVIIPPSVGADEAATLFPQGWTERRPYLRTLTL